MSIFIFAALNIFSLKCTPSKMYPIKWTQSKERYPKLWTRKSPTKMDRETDSDSRKWTTMIHCKYLEGRKWNRNGKTAASAYMG